MQSHPKQKMEDPQAQGAQSLRTGFNLSVFLFHPVLHNLHILGQKLGSINLLVLEFRCILGYMYCTDDTWLWTDLTQHFYVYVNTRVPFEMLWTNWTNHTHKREKHSKTMPPLKLCSQSKRIPWSPVSKTIEKSTNRRMNPLPHLILPQVINKHDQSCLCAVTSLKWAQTICLLLDPLELKSHYQVHLGSPRSCKRWRDRRDAWSTKDGRLKAGDWAEIVQGFDDFLKKRHTSGRLSPSKKQVLQVTSWAFDQPGKIWI